MQKKHSYRRIDLENVEETQFQKNSDISRKFRRFIVQKNSERSRKCRRYIVQKNPDRSRKCRKYIVLEESRYIQKIQKTHSSRRIQIVLENLEDTYSSKRIHINLENLEDKLFQNNPVCIQKVNRYIQDNLEN